MRDPRLVGAASLIAWALATAAVSIALQFAAAGPHPVFNPYGINAVVAWLALELAVAALLVPRAGRTTALAAMLALLVLAAFVLGAVAVGAMPFLPAVAAKFPWVAQTVPVGIFALVTLWWIGAMIAVIRSLAATPRLYALARVAALWVALAAVTAVVPHAPVFVARDFDVRNANLWEHLLARNLPPRNSEPAPDQTAADTQGSLLQAEAARLEPPKTGVANVYALGIAGWADQDVFLKELDGGLAAMSAILPIHGHVLRLVNHRETTESTPLANQRNFAAAVHAVGAVMDKKEDILVLLMTSHGTPSGFALRLPNEITSELTPQEVAATLDKEGIKNRIVVVSACYSGTFVPPLANDDTIVLTASDAKSTSFGCAPERDWTYFGDAFFRQSIRRGTDLQHAFDSARILISGWEMMDRAPPSNPQAHFGPALVGKLARSFAPVASPGQ
jgi:hypothetical protein